MSGFQIRSIRKKIEVEETEVDLIVVEGKGVFQFQ